MTSEALKKQYSLNKKTSAKVPRQSNLELLRIISMLLILMHHYSVHGGFNLSNVPLTFNVFLVQFLSLGGKLGVNLFMLITGYFMVNSKFNFKKLIRLEFQVLFYSIGFMLIFYLTGLSDFNIIAAVKNCFPVIFGYYGFVTAYVALYLIIPAMNKLIHAIDRKTHLKYICVGMVLFSVIPTFTTSFIDSSPLIWLVVLYLIASYIRLYPSSVTENCKKNIFIGVLAFAFIILSTVVFDILGFEYSRAATYFMQLQMLPVAICSVALFLGFKNMNIGYRPFINGVAASAFGVFLIHENFFVRPFLWKQLLKNGSYLNSKYLILHAIVSIIGVYIVCTVIDRLRIIIERPLWRMIEPKADKIGERVKMKFSSLLEKI